MSKTAADRLVRALPAKSFIDSVYAPEGTEWSSQGEGLNLTPLTILRRKTNFENHLTFIVVTAELKHLTPSNKYQADINMTIGS